MIRLQSLMRVAACAFDVYGTLLDVETAVRRHAGRLGASASAVSELWRAKQLEYTWTRTLMLRYADFRTLTEQALDYALAKIGVDDTTVGPLLLEAYRDLDAYADTHVTLAALRDAGVRLAVVSNGTPELLAEGLAAADLTPYFDEVISVAELSVYKPAPAVYELATTRLALAPDRIGFLSANSWDVAGARAAGLHAVWVNRAGNPDEYGLRGTVPELDSLTGLPALLLGEPGPSAGTAGSPPGGVDLRPSSNPSA